MSKVLKDLVPVLLVLSALLGACSPTAPGLPQPGDTPTLTPEPTPGAHSTVEFEGISFQYPSSLASQIQPRIISTRFGPDYAPWDQSPSHIAFSFQDPYTSARQLYWQGFTPDPAPVIFIYRTTDFPPDTLGWDGLAQIQALQALLDSRPEAAPEQIPVLPLTNAGQSFHAKLKYLDFTGGSGVRFVTQYTQEMRQVNNQELIYAFQGLTGDGAFYISALLPVRSNALPESMDVTEAEIPNFWANFSRYIRDTAARVDSLPDEAFDPGLSTLDAVFESLSFPFVEPTPVPLPQTPTAVPTLAELEVPSFVYPTPIPTLDATFSEYQSRHYQVAFEVPDHWQELTGDHYQGPDGYFEITPYPDLASGLMDAYSGFSSRMARACAWEVNSEPGRYGLIPYFYVRSGSYGQAQCLIFPGEAGSDAMAALLFDGPGGRLAVLRADVRQMHRIGDTFHYLEGFDVEMPTPPSGSGLPLESPPAAVPPRQVGELTLEEYALFPASQASPGPGLSPEALGEAGERRLAWRELPQLDEPVYAGGKRVTWELEEAGLYSRVWTKMDAERVYAFLFPMLEPFSVRLHGWDDRWVLEVDGSLVIDGRLVNLELGYGEIFGWQLVQGKPFFFFEKDGRYGISYDGSELPLAYDQILHRQTYSDVLDVHTNPQMAWFYAQRDGTWYYVELGVYEEN